MIQTALIIMCTVLLLLLLNISRKVSIWLIHWKVLLSGAARHIQIYDATSSDAASNVGGVISIYRLCKMQQQQQEKYEVIQQN